MASLRQYINDRFKKPATDINDENAEAAAAAAPESKLKSIVKTLLGAGFSLSIIIGLKSLVPIVFAAAPAAIASVGIPVAMIGITAYGVIKSSRHIQKRLKHHKRKIQDQYDDISGKKALLLALRKNKFELGAFIGSMALLAVGVVADFSNFATAFDFSKLDKLAEAAAVETTVIGADELIERGHKPKHVMPMVSRLKAAFTATRTRQFKDSHYQPRHAKRKPGPALQLA